MKRYTTIIADNEYEVIVGENEGIFYYDFLRNGKLKSSTTAPVENRDDIKMWISEKIIQMAIYDINHFVGNINISK